MILNNLRFIFLSTLKFSGHFIYPSKLNWIGKKPENWHDISLILVLNHTSLFEFVYCVTLPYSFLKQLSKKLVIPVAQKTLDAPISGLVFKYLTPNTIGLTRKRDESWQYFLDNIKRENICIFMPEGQMKRLNGLDKNGQPMKVKTGVYELMQKYRGKNMVLVYSHGLHHVFPPGARFPKIFKKIEADIEFLAVDEYLKKFDTSHEPAIDVAQDLQIRRDQHCKN